MDSERWSLVKQLFEGALARQPADRRAWLEESCGRDAELRQEVDSLLEAHEESPGHLDSPVWAAVDFETEEWAGRQVGQYRILREIGRGGMGVVYAAEDVDLGRKVALKFLSEDLARDAAYLERFRREARVASTLNHPNVCTIFGWGTFEGRPYISMELLEGRTLKERLDGGAMPPAEILDCVIGIAEALVAAHAAGITHRDIKPANIFLTARQQVKVLDFGLARAARDPLREGGDTGLTDPGQPVGTMAYMSPEQARGEPLDGRTDIFSLGAVLCEMASGRPAFSGATGAVVMDAILNRTPPGIAAAGPALAPAIAKALQKHPAARYQSALELRDDLLRVQRGEGSRFRSRKRVGIIAAAAGVLVALAAGAFWFGAPAKAVTSLAVLPLLNLANDPKAEYLIDGISESLMQKLSRLPKLRVIARSTVFSYKGKPIDPRAAGRDLKVEAVLAGSVRQHGDALVIQAELVNTADGARLWGAQFERPAADLQEVQEEIAAQIAGGLRIRLNPAEQGRLRKRDTVSAQAYQSYVQGRYFWNKRTAQGFQKALELFQQAVALDANFALAHAGLADCYILLNSYGLMEMQQASAKAEAAARRALRIDDSLAEAHNSLAFIYGMHRFRYKDAETEYRKAIALNPSYATAHQWYSLFLTAMLRRDDALREARTAVDLDPVSLIIRSDYAMDLMMLRDYDAARRECQRTLELDPGFTTAHWYLGAISTYQGRYEEAIRELTYGAASTFGDAASAAKLGIAYAYWGKKDQALGMARVLEKAVAKDAEAACGLSAIYAVLGRRDQGIFWLEKAYNGRAGCMIWIKATRDFDNLRGDPRYRRIERLAGFE